jgi:hypothetical protein
VTKKVDLVSRSRALNIEMEKGKSMIDDTDKLIVHNPRLSEFQSHSLFNAQKVQKKTTKR